MYRKTLALRDNPFNPKAASITQEGSAQCAPFCEYLSDLDRRGLRIDKCAALEKLLCPKIVEFEQHMDRFKEILEERGYSLESPETRGSGAVVIAIRGAQGSGKTTLASWMIATAMSFDKPSPWYFFETKPPERSLYGWAEDEFNEEAEHLQSEIQRVASPGNHIAVLIEDVTRDTWHRAIGLCEKFRNRPRLFVLTTHDLGLLEEDPRSLSSSVPIESFSLSAVEPDDAAGFVAHRIDQFREPKRQEIISAWPIFPFTLPAVQHWVETSGRQGSGNPITVRVLNTHLSKRIIMHHKALMKRRVMDVALAEGDALGDYLLQELS